MYIYIQIAEGLGDPNYEPGVQLMTLGINMTQITSKRNSLAMKKCIDTAIKLVGTMHCV